MDELNNSFTGIWLTENQWLSMLRDVQFRAPQEACGLLGGLGHMTVAVVSVTNILNSRDRYRMEPSEQLHAFNLFEAQGLEITGIYHSHPAGPSQPSQTDIDEAYYPDAVYLIWSKSLNDWECRAFRIQGGSFSEVDILIAHP
jgi:[CysO sulfur-carrier protein]-S-L-cysteine hydrolase